MNLTNASVGLGVVVTLAGIIGAWYLVQYRLDVLETRFDDAEAALESLHDSNNKSAEEVKCLICEAHDIKCPGC